MYFFYLRRLILHVCSSEARYYSTKNLWNGDTRYRIWDIWIFPHFLTFLEISIWISRIFRLLGNFPHFLSGKSRREKVRENSNSPNYVVSITNSYDLCALDWLVKITKKVNFFPSQRVSTLLKLQSLKFSSNNAKRKKLVVRQ